MGGKSTAVVTFPIAPQQCQRDGKRLLSVRSKPSLN
jgi:hypothetical protein